MSPLQSLALQARDTNTVLEQTHLLPILGRHGQRLLAYGTDGVPIVDELPKEYPFSQQPAGNHLDAITRADEHQQNDVSPYRFVREDGKVYRIRGQELPSAPRYPFNVSYRGDGQWFVKGDVWPYIQPGAGSDPDTNVEFQVEDRVLQGAEGWIVLKLIGRYVDNFTWHVTQTPQFEFTAQLQTDISVKRADGTGDPTRTGTFGMLPIAWVSLNRSAQPLIFSRGRLQHIPPMIGVVITPETRFNLIDQTLT